MPSGARCASSMRGGHAQSQRFCFGVVRTAMMRIRRTAAFGHGVGMACARPAVRTAFRRSHWCFTAQTGNDKRPVQVLYGRQALACTWLRRPRSGQHAHAQASCAIVYYWRGRSAASGIIAKPQPRPRLSHTKQSPLGGVSCGAALGEPGHIQFGISIRIPTPVPSCVKVFHL